MDSPVSAFAIYNANKKQKHRDNKHKKKKTAKTSPNFSADTKTLNNEIGDKLMKKLAKKIKKQEKKSKNIKFGQKTAHKKKKSKVNFKKAKRQDKNTETSINNDSISESDDVPTLVLPPNQVNGTVFVDDDCSHSSTGYEEFVPVHTDSAEEGLKVFKWMIAPFDPHEFLNHIWEKKPLHITRDKPTYYKDIFSTPLIDDMLRTENIQFTKNIDITSYIDGKRETHNVEGRAHPHMVWDFYLNGCSIRLLNPQTYIPKLHLMSATLQEFFNSFVGANAYLTPPDSQGFAPHYDDIEAFILQVEGKKHWRIYKPREKGEILPRVSSKNFTQDEIGEPLMEITLKAGDMLYFPRGYIHQGITIDGEHSLHLTVSMYQKHSWADLLEKMLPAALEIAINENIKLRQGLPFDIYDNFGLVNSESVTPRRQEIVKIVQTLFDTIKNYLPIDGAVDQMAKHFQHDALPPVLNDLEKAVTIYGDSDVMIENGIVINRVEMSLDTKIRLLRKNVIRMISEEDSVRLYYYTENSLEYHGCEPTYLEIDIELIPAVETLITSYPNYVSIENLDVPNDSDKLSFAEALWSRGIIMTKYPLENICDD